MSVEFDKEIDAILRDLGKAGIGELRPPAELHPEPDEFAAFSANMMREADRNDFLLHLSDCARCRQILAAQSLAELEPETVVLASAATASNRPWRLWIHLIRKPAVALAAALLVFAGLFAIAFLRSSENREVSSRIEVSETGPAVSSAESDLNSKEPANNSAVQNSMPQNAANANLATNSSQNRPTEIAKAPENSRAATPNSAPSVVQNADAASPNAPAAAPPPPENAATERPAVTAAAPPPLAAEISKNRDLDQIQGGLKTGEDPSSKSVLKKDKASSERQTDAESRRSEDTGSRRRFGGKIFELRGGIWTDSEYRNGEALTFLKRESARFREMDRELQATVEAIGTPIIVKWGNKAFRID